MIGIICPLIRIGLKYLPKSEEWGGGAGDRPLAPVSDGPAKWCSSYVARLSRHLKLSKSAINLRVNVAKKCSSKKRLLY